MLSPVPTTVGLSHIQSPFEIQDHLAPFFIADAVHAVQHNPCTHALPAYDKRTHRLSKVSGCMVNHNDEAMQQHSKRGQPVIVAGG